MSPERSVKDQSDRSSLFSLTCPVPIESVPVLYPRLSYYFMPPLRIIGFWLLMGVAAVWFVIAVYKFGRS
jgi:hypothetical protein